LATKFAAYFLGGHSDPVVCAFYFPVLFHLPVSVKLIAVKTASEMT